MSNKVYEVYVCRYNGEIVYIGEGALNRHLHCTSGTSNVFELNELYFLGDKGLFEVDQEPLLDGCYIFSSNNLKETLDWCYDNLNIDLMYY